MKTDLITFLSALFEHGWIEIRVIEDKRGGALVERSWYSTPADLVAAIPLLLQRAEDRNAAIFFGVLPRNERGKGKSEDAGASRVVWADFDIKDFAGGEVELRARLQSFALEPTIVVRSGHGLHAYWLIKEELDAARLSHLAHGIANSRGGDHAFDAARILRLPGTFNRKDPAHPILVEIESFKSNLIYDACAFEDALSSFEQSETPPPDESENDTSAGSQGNGTSERVRRLLASDKRLRDLFLGVGKVSKRADGVNADCSSSGYDFSFVYALIKLDVREHAELEDALAARPDGAARQKGRRYIARTVRNALAAMHRAESGEVELPTLDFEVTEARIYESTPASYELVIGDKTMLLSSSTLRSHKKFQLAFLDTFHRVPAMPKANQWPAVVNHWLGTATRVEMPPEATNEIAAREEIERIVDQLPFGENGLDLDRGKALRLDDTKAFKTATVTRLLAEQGQPALASDVCRHLRLLGCTSGTSLIDGKKTRAWRLPWNAT